MRRWGCWLTPAGLGVVLLGTLAPGQDEPPKPAKVVEAEAFILRDRQGNRRAELGLDDGASSFTLFDDKGHRRARLAVAADGSARVSFFDDKGNDRGGMSVGPDGEPRFDRDKNGAPAAARGEPPPRLEPQPVIRPVVAEVASPKAGPLYQQYCSSCHGADGRGTRVRPRMPKIPDFADARWQGSRSDAQLLAGIRDGRGTDMPPFAAELQPDQARALVAFVRAFGPDRAAPAAAAGDFEQRWQQLQKQWEDLDQQMKALTNGAEKR